MSWKYYISICKDRNKWKAAAIAKWGKDAKNDPNVPWAGDCTPAVKIGNKSVIVVAVEDDNILKQFPDLKLFTSRAAAKLDEPTLFPTAVRAMETEPVADDDQLGVIFGINL